MGGRTNRGPGVFLKNLPTIYFWSQKCKQMLGANVSKKNTFARFKIRKDVCNMQR